jgi:hypothetical protein
VSGFELDDAQLALIQFAKWYKNIRELPPSDRPDDAVIDNDAELDRWWDAFVRDQQRKAGRPVSSGMVSPTDIGQNAIPFYGAVPKE